jgi:hypothetical protein
MYGLKFVSAVLICLLEVIILLLTVTPRLLKVNISCYPVICLVILM